MTTIFQKIGFRFWAFALASSLVDIMFYSSEFALAYFFFNKLLFSLGKNIPKYSTYMYMVIRTRHSKKNTITVVYLIFWKIKLKWTIIIDYVMKQ